MWYTPYQIKDGTHHSISLVVHTIPEHRVHKYIGRETDTHPMKQARTYKHTHVTYAKKIHIRLTLFIQTSERKKNLRDFGQRKVKGKI